MAPERTREQTSRKISETFLEFAEPLWAPLGPAATEEEWEQALQIAFTVWNSLVFDVAQQSQRGVEQLRELASQEPGVGLLVERLIARKQNLFADDQRLIGKYGLHRRQGELRLWAEARQPS